MSYRDILHAAAEFVKAKGNIELYNEINRILDDIYDIREKNIELQEDKKALSEVIEVQNKQLELQGKMKFLPRYQSYWIVGEEGKPADGPFCTNCFDKERKGIRLTQTPNHADWFCPNCRNHYFISWHHSSALPTSFERPG
ncbi:MAG: hypothetical protein ACYS8W_17335 [Planctomycetota bacterium]|jgi:hypothetical protein